MAEFELRSFQQILADMIAYVSANTPITDMNDGGVTLTILEAAATEDSNTYIQMLDIIRVFNLDNLTGDDLVEKGYEYGLIKEEARAASGYVTIADSNFTKISTTIYSGLPGPTTGSTTLYAVANDEFTATGSLIIGRNNDNSESVDYSSFTDFTTYYRFNLITPLTKDHGTDETVVLAQGGDRDVSAGTVVYAPATDTDDQVNFSIQSDATILDGEDELEDILVVAVDAGDAGNVGSGRINSFQTLPFATAEVSNPSRFSNGRDDESDDEFKERIKNHIQSLSRGVITALLAFAQQVESDEQMNKVLSAEFVEATTLNELNFLYVDDGSGLEPLVHSADYELVLNEAAGTERFLQLDLDSTPLLKAALISGAASPYNIPAGYTLIVSVNDIEETITFGGTTDFSDPSAATAEEVVVAINDRMNLIEARTTESKTKVLIQAKATENERLKVVGGTAATVLNFRTGVEVETLKLYVNDRLLSKDGFTAYVDNENEGPYTLVNPSTLTIVVDDKSANEQTITFTTESTVDDVITTINNELAGAIATAIDGGTRIRITSNNPDKAASKIEVTGGTANSVLGFSTEAVSGIGSDYTLNRFNGQIELEVPLVADDEVTAGSPYTRAYFESSSTGPYAIATGEILIYQVDDIVDSAVDNDVDTTHFEASTLISIYDTDDHFKGCYARFKDDTTTVALRGVYREIIAYDAGTGEFEVDSAYPTTPAVGDTFEIVRIITIPSDETLDPEEMADFLNELAIGVNFYAREKGNGDTYLRIETNSLDDEGSLRILSASTAIGLGFDTDTTVTSEISNYGYIESNNSEDFTFGRGQTLIVIMDNDPANKTVSVDMDVDGEIDTATSTTEFEVSEFGTSYPDDDFFVGFKCRFTDDTTTTAIRSEIRTVIAYDGATGAFEVDSAYSDTPDVGDTFELIPVTAKNVEDLLSANAFSALATLASIRRSNNGKNVQIESLLLGSQGSVQVAGGTANDFEIAFTEDGTTGGQFHTASVAGLSINLGCSIDDGNSPKLDVTITDITDTGTDYIITVDVDSGGTDISAYTVAQNAVIIPRNQFNFLTEPVEGVDAYKYHGGLIQQVQWTIDSKDTDYDTYPGVKAAGVQIEVAAPLITFVEIIVDVTTKGSVSLNTISNKIKAAISEYVNGLGVGEDVIKSEIVKVVMLVEGVADVEVNTPSDNQIIQSSEIARTTDSLIVVG